LNDGLILSGTGRVNLGTGALTVNDQVSGMSGNSSLAAGALAVGSSANGSFTQSTGTNSVGSVTLGVAPGVSGAYTLNGGLLSLSSLAVGSGSATFNFGGGTLAPTAPWTSSVPLTLTGSGGNAFINTSIVSALSSTSVVTPGTLSLNGYGLVTLSGTNAFFSGLNVSSGYLIIDGASSLVAGSSLVIGSMGGTGPISGLPAWIGPAVGSWNSASNWSSGAPPSGSGVSALLGPRVANTISLDSAQTLGSLLINNQAGYTITPGGEGWLTLSNTGGVPAQLSVLSGSQSIAAPISLAGTNTSISVVGHGRLTLSGDIIDSAGVHASLLYSSMDIPDDIRAHFRKAVKSIGRLEDAIVKYSTAQRGEENATTRRHNRQGTQPKGLGRGARRDAAQGIVQSGQRQDFV